MANFAATYYVSSAGNDSNSGQSSSSPWQSLSKVNGASLTGGDVVLFKSGDSWYGTLRPKSGNSSAPITYGSYGTGEKPLIHFSVNTNSSSDWTQDGTNIWKSARTFSSDVGNIIFNNETSVGFKKWDKSSITSQGHFFYDTSGQYVYLYSAGNPTLKYSDIKLALSVALVDIWDKDYITVENMAFKYTGGHAFGIGESSNIIVKNCDIGWIGGGRLGGSSSQVRYGNGVEFWANTSKCRVEGCKLWEIYDAALTNQSTEVCTQTNIVYTKNIVWNSEYSFEYFSRPNTSTTSNIQFTNNTCYNAGYGWGHAQRPDPSGNHIQIWDFVAPISNFVISNNILVEATSYIFYFPKLSSRPTSTISMDYNTAYTSRNIAYVGGVGYSGSQFANYKSATGWDAHSLNANPLFVNAPGTNFSLAANSPSIDTGNPASPVDPDGTRTDMGALYYNHSVVIASPIAYNVTGGGSYVSGGSGVPVGLSNSQTGVNYQVKLGGVNNGSAVAGSGSALSFGNKTVAGAYTVVATHVSNGSVTSMTGSATVTVTEVIDPSPSPILVSGITVSPTALSITVSATQQITTAVLPTNATNKTVTWSSSNGSVAMVNSSGLVTGIATGNATITAKTQDGSKVATSTITVTPTSTSNTFFLGINTAGASSETGVNGNWIVSSFKAGANMTVNRVNLYVGQASGRARLGIYTTNSAGEPGTLLSQTNDVSLINGWNSGLLSSAQNLVAGATYWLAFEVSSSTTRLYYNISYGRSRYKSFAYAAFPYAAPTSISIGSGIYSVYADNSGVALPTIATGVSVNPTMTSISVNATRQLTATVLPTNATNKTVTWSSSNGSVATVNPSGLVTGLAAGTAYITAKTQDGSKIATSTITVTPTITSNTSFIGMNTAGASSETGVNGNWIVSSFKAGENMTVNRINLYVGQASGNARLGIYTSNNAGEPGILLAQTGDVSLINGWNSGLLSSAQNLVAGATYWLAFEVSSSTTRLYYNRYDGRSRYKSFAYAAFPYAAPSSISIGAGIYSVYADNNGLKSADLNETAMGSGIENLKDMVKIDVFPNPSQGNVTVRFSELPEVGSRIEILDLSGRKVATRQILETSEEFNLNQLPAGIYLVKSFVGSNEKTQKLIITK